MAVTEKQRRMSYSKMRGLVSFFTAVIKSKKAGFSGFVHKLMSNHQLCQHLDTQRILLREGSGREEIEGREGGAALHLQGSLDCDDAQVKPSDFDYLKVIGKGSFGKVLLARHRNSKDYYAVKVLQKQAILRKREQRHVMVERSVLLKGLQHPFLVGLHFSFQTSNTLYFVLDFVNGGELFYHLQREGAFTEARATFYSAEMASALGYLHSLNIVYRDLKPENILLDAAGHVVLTDFGLCKEGVAMGGTMQTFCGTPEYLAPEVLLGHAYSRAVDWWGLGCVLYEMLYGLPPFYSHSKAVMFRNILHAPLRLKSGVSQSAHSLLQGLLERDCTKRLGGSNDLEELQSQPFFKSINWKDLVARKIRPPFIPKVTGPCDVQYFDRQFTVMPVPASLGLVDRCQKGVTNEAFSGFSYTPHPEFKASDSHNVP
ncbi:serine/threonine-protein kinase Sgk2b isoform X1 [Hypomesus transpacificus]|uniref:serine/threonine-protein kinase Sgk2b isoform X1 n=2 Tax=Hypomesus transpacificus TaxID=137520 RepID=UPI001F07C231|nr:serine/threonine-protein kinase Sgk2b isoform X1 [Hypomesus transpacificus]